MTLDSFAEKVIDAVGAGDALLAYAALALYVDQEQHHRLGLGSFSAAIECEQKAMFRCGPRTCSTSSPGSSVSFI